MKKAVTVVIASSIALASLAPIHASAFGLGGLMGGGEKSSSGGAVDVDGFLKSAEEADGLIRKSADTLFMALATKQQLDTHAETMKAANAVADPKEKEAALKKASDDQQAQLAKMNFAEKAKEAEKTMDTKKQAQTGAAIHNFILGMLKDKEVMDRGQGVISSISSNPMMVTKLTKAKEVISSVSSQMGNISTIASGIQKMSKVAKVEALPTKASDAPKPVAD